MPGDMRTTLSSRIAIFETRIAASTQERDAVMREIDSTNLDKLLAMPAKRARTVLKQIQKQNALRFKQVKKLDHDIERLQYRLHELKAERWVRHAG